MASPIPELPLGLLVPDAKYRVIVYLVNLGIPARVGRSILQQWGETVGVDIDPSDYAMIDNRLSPGPVGT